MTGEYKRRSVTCVEEDRISNLPAHLKDSILERLPVQEAVKTSILFRNWRYRWTTMRDLVFDNHFFKKYAKNGAFGRNGFIRIINQVLLLHKGPILKFHLYIPTVSLDSSQEVDQWMLILSGNGVTELAFTNWNHRYEVPSHVFSCRELRKLKLSSCIVKRPLEFEGLVNLEDLDLRNIVLGDNLFGTQISLPQLKKLSLFFCTNVSNFNIKATKLWSLVVVASLDASRQSVPAVGGSSVTLFAIEDFVGGERKKLVRGLSHFPKIQDLHIEGVYIKFLFAENVPKWLPHPVNSLESLRLHFFQLGHMDQLHGALRLLRNSPNLEQLYLEMETQLVVGLGPALIHLEAPKLLGLYIESVANCGD